MIEPAQPPVDRRPPVSPQLAFRVAILGGLALIMFGIIFFRLWYLQVLSGDQYVQQANTNRVRDLPIQAARGEIVDRNGTPVVSDRPTDAVQIVPSELPPVGPARQALYRSLANVLQMSPQAIAHTVHQQRLVTPYANVTLKIDAGQDVLDYLAERQTEFPGVVQQQVYIRDYPNGDLAAQLLGTVGQISPAELAFPRFRGVRQGTVVGQAGVEWSYDRYLRGRNGVQRVEVDAAGRVQRQLATTPPIAGQQLRLSLDAGLQKEGQAALVQGIGLAQANGHAPTGGAFVALNPINGEVLAMGSTPTFDPNVFAKPISQSEYNRLFGGVNGQPGPQFNRAIDGAYPTGSTFKPITAMASLTSGLITPSTPIAGGQCLSVGSAGQQFCNAGHADYGTLSLIDALRVSSDVFFYTLGEQANGVPGEVIQTWAKRLGLGHATGIDLPGEFVGTVPDRAWRDRVNAKEIACERRKHVHFCGISDGRQWSVGDNVNLAVGQGDLQATPLQMAVAYSALYKGYVVRPHLGLEVDDSQGRLIQQISPSPVRNLHLNPTYQQAILDGLHAATSQPGGTSFDVWQGFPRPIYGKTGTAQRAGQDDQSWYVAIAPDPVRPIVVAVTIESGGFGAQAAAPAARLIISKWFNEPLTLVAGQSKTL